VKSTNTFPSISESLPLLSLRSILGPGHLARKMEGRCRGRGQALIVTLTLLWYHSQVSGSVAQGLGKRYSVPPSSIRVRCPGIGQAVYSTSPGLLFSHMKAGPTKISNPHLAPHVDMSGTVHLDTWYANMAAFVMFCTLCSASPELRDRAFDSQVVHN
jgi:hypothetical protein